MTDDDKMLKMFIAVHGEISRGCYLEVTDLELDGVSGIKVMKDGNICWEKTKEDILFDYITRGFTDD